MNQHQPQRRNLSALSKLALPGLLAFATLTGSAQAGPSLPHQGSSIQGAYARIQVEAPAEERLASELSEAETPRYCPSSERVYRKSLLITAFPRREQGSSNAGGLHGAEHRFPELLGEKLAGAHIERYQQIPQSLPPSGLEPARLAQQVRQLAQRADAQLVLTGELLDMSLTHTRDVQAPGLVTRSRNQLVSGLRLNPDWDSRQRQFVLNLRLLDGFTGEPVFERQYQIQGAWNPRRHQRVGFGSPQFWETHYGEQVNELLTQVSAQVSEAIRCQPLASRLSAGQPGQPPLLQAGAHQGLQPGDRLPLYRATQREVPGVYRQYTTYLVDTGRRVTVVESQPEYSVVRLEADQPLHGAYIALTPKPESLILSQY